MKNLTILLILFIVLFAFNCSENQILNSLNKDDEGYSSEELTKENAALSKNKKETILHITHTDWFYYVDKNGNYSDPIKKIEYGRLVEVSAYA